MGEPEPLHATSDAHARLHEARQIAFNIGQSAPANTFLAIWMAAAAGLYESYGLHADIVPMVGGLDMAPALQSGRIQVMHIGMSSVLRAYNAGARL